MSRTASGTGSSFVSANNVLQRKWNQRAYQMHVAKRKGMKTTVDNTSPKTFVHLQVNMKKLQAEEERQAMIDHENRILLAKLTNIIRSGGQLDNWNFEYDAAPKTLNSSLKQREQERIERENLAMLKRLNNTKGTYSFDKMEDEYLMHEYYKSMKAQATKNYEVDVRGVNDPDEFVFYAKDRHVNKEKTFIEGDIQESIADAPEDVTDGISTKLPSLDGSRKLPTREKIRRRPTKLPLLGTERKKAEEKKKKDAAIKPPAYNQKDEAAKLFKATKGMGDPEQILVRTLAKRTYQQRQDTIQKFEENYELTLEEELKNNLSAEYDEIVDALLATREDLDALTLRRSLKGEDSLVEPVIEILCTRSNAAIAAIKKSYLAKYGISLDDEIKKEIKGQLKHLFLALAAGCRVEGVDVDEDKVMQDAEALKNAETMDRWDTTSIRLTKLMRDASLAHLREVFLEYDKLTDSNLAKELENSLRGDVKDAMLCLARCVYNCAQFMAERLHASLMSEADDWTLIRIIVTRSELDLPLIRRSYKRQFKQTLVESLEQRCQAAYKTALVQMVVVHGAPHKVEQQPEGEGDGEQDDKALTVPKSPQSKPLKRPSPNPNARVPSDNPLLKSTLQASEQAKKIPGTPQRPGQNGLKPKGVTTAPRSPIKPRQVAPVKSGGPPTMKKTSTPPRKVTPPGKSTPPRKTTPPKQSKLTQEAAVTPQASASKGNKTEKDKTLVEKEKKEEKKEKEEVEKKDEEEKAVEKKEEDAKKGEEVTSSSQDEIKVDDSRTEKKDETDSDTKSDDASDKTESDRQNSESLMTSKEEKAESQPEGDGQTQEDVKTELNDSSASQQQESDSQDAVVSEANDAPASTAKQENPSTDTEQASS